MPIFKRGLQVRHKSKPNGLVSFRFLPQNRTEQNGNKFQFQFWFYPKTAPSQTCSPLVMWETERVLPICELTQPLVLVCRASNILLMVWALDKSIRRTSNIKTLGGLNLVYTRNVP